MLNNIDVTSWTPQKVKDWLIGVCDNSSWLDEEKIFQSNINGKKLLMMTSEDIEQLGATKINEQELVLEAIEKLIFYNSNKIKETLQSKILNLSCQSRGLNRQLILERNFENRKGENQSTEPNLTNNGKFIDRKQRVSLNTLYSVSSIVRIVRQITNILNSAPFSNYDDYRTMKSLLLALSIELTSTAQRDQFVDRPNDIIEKSAKALADYCDRIVQGTRDILLIEPFNIETVRIRRSDNENSLGFKVKSLESDCVHVIDEIAPLSPAKKTNKLCEGDEILQFNQYIVGWTRSNVENLSNCLSESKEIVLVVKKCPTE